MRYLFLAAVVVLNTVHASDQPIPLLTIDQRTYTNVTITSVGPTHAVIRHASGAARIPLTSLPPELQKELGYDPQTAATIAAEQKLKEDERQKQLAKQKTALATAAAWRGEQKNVMVLGLKSSGACLAVIDGEGTREIRITGLPSSVGKYLSDIQKAEANVDVAAQNVNRMARALNDLPPQVTGDEEYVEYHQAKVERAKRNLRNAQDSLESVERAAQTLKAREQSIITFSARQTAQKYGPHEIWEYAGPAVYKAVTTKTLVQTNAPPPQTNLPAQNALPQTNPPAQTNASPPNP